MALLSFHCPYCKSKHCKTHTSYKVLGGEERSLYHCQDCGKYFSKTKNTALEGLRTPLGFIGQVLEAINDGMGINAACRTFKITPKSIKRWQKRLGGLKETLLTYCVMSSIFTTDNRR
jgi:transposase-like protein